MAKSPNITGPYTGYAHNPVLTNANTSEYCTWMLCLDLTDHHQLIESVVQTVGHADLFNDTAGNWWAVALATRNATVN